MCRDASETFVTGGVYQLDSRAQADFELADGGRQTSDASSNASAPKPSASGRRTRCDTGFSDAEAIRRLAVDPHAPPEFRCNGVIRNVDAFYEAFDVAEDDALFLEPQRRVRIWN